MLACQAASMAGACVCVWAMHELGDHQAGISITDAAGWVRATGGQESWADRVRCLLGVQTGGRPELMAAAGGGAACPTIDATAISIEPVKAPIDAPLTLGIDHHRRCCHLLPWLPSGHPQPSHCVSALAWERDEPPSYFNRKGGADGSTLIVLSSRPRHRLHQLDRRAGCTVADQVYGGHVQRKTYCRHRRVPAGRPRVR